MRYNRRLNYHIDIPEELMDLRIPKLLLQPVVENSLVHGMKDKHSVSVTITARMEDSTLVLCVEDERQRHQPGKTDKGCGKPWSRRIFTGNISDYIIPTGWCGSSTALPTA